MGNSQVLFDNLNGLTPGIYILRAFFDGFILQNKLVKANQTVFSFKEIRTLVYFLGVLYINIFLLPHMWL